MPRQFYPCMFWLFLTLPLFGRANDIAPRPVMRVGTILQIQLDHPVVKLMHNAYAELGIEMQLELMPTERALRELNRGVLLDATLAATVAMEKNNPKLLRVPVVIYALEWSVFTADPALQINDWSQLNAYRVLMIQGMVAVEQRLLQNPDQQFEAALSLEQALRRLDIGRNQLAVLPKFEAEAMLNKLQLTKVRAMTPSLSKVPAYHYVHPKHRSMVEPLARVLSRLTGQPIVRSKATSVSTENGWSDGDTRAITGGK
ncbi:MAG: hypothetical protein KJ930_03740 [Gammaproteobacteria bacterium]|nr:hypothetical protein [Gammaproteobacteria bacterium]MBU2223202.1 hypothetical protein [Gammaproteobacteria bacterium]MBU2426590.1 hypothetical protein [Gammaproteobacteria bacterium]